jgi:PAS domain S-box-containing protein
MRDRHLSQREAQILRLASDGLTDQAIANTLGISVATVGTYWSRIRTKLGPHSRTELVANHLRSQSSEALTNLRDENERLTKVLDQHTRAETQLNAALDLFRAVIDNAPDAILVIDSEGEVRLANSQATTMFGYGLGELIGLHIRALVPHRFHGRHNRLRRQYMAHPEKRRMGEHSGTSALRANGEEFEIAASLSAFDTSEGTLVTCMIRDLAKTNT